MDSHFLKVLSWYNSGYSEFDENGNEAQVVQDDSVAMIQSIKKLNDFKSMEEIL